ncbi:MAG: hypothetical protein FJZ00_07955 [Candidatus Sericytochromatia bacterium]|uniref:Uncharacterized protein n=1 Tax=Candidatus Tanganyikabacteria bacterium TaxID=2961651 RepID=A0A938BJ80_9BACT|nr:hypothetical protein [Candidatus Tanganyikabacteria bacterium]
MQRVESPVTVHRGQITVTTRTHAKAQPADLVRALSRDWGTWFKVGRTRNVVETATSLSFEFSPLKLPGMPWIRVTEDKSKLDRALRRAHAGEKALVPVQMADGFTGKAFFLIEKAPQGGSFITTKWAGVKPDGWRGSFDAIARVMGEAHTAMEEPLLSSLDDYAQALGRGGEKAATAVADANANVRIAGAVTALARRGLVQGTHVGAAMMETMASHTPLPMRLAGNAGAFLMRSGGSIAGRMLKALHF